MHVPSRGVSVDSRVDQQDLSPHASQATERRQARGTASDDDGIVVVVLKGFDAGIAGIRDGCGPGSRDEGWDE